MNPGKPGSVTAFVFAFLVWPVGLILGIVSITRSRRAGLPAAGLSIAAVILSSISGVFAVIIVAAALAGGDGTDSTADAARPAAVPDVPAAPEADAGGQVDATTVTCDSIVQDVVALTPSSPLSPQLLAVYEIETVANHVDELVAGQFAVPDGQTDIKFIECAGLGSFEDGSKTPITYYESVDVNDEVFIGYEPVDAGQ